MIERMVAGIIVLAPDYSVPGAKEQVALEVDDAYFIANYPRSSLGLLIAMRQQSDRICDRCGIRKTGGH